MAAAVAVVAAAVAAVAAVVVDRDNYKHDGAVGAHRISGQYVQACKISKGRGASVLAAHRSW